MAYSFHFYLLLLPRLHGSGRQEKKNTRINSLADLDALPTLLNHVFIWGRG